MKAWYDRLPIHRKLVAVAVVVTTAALALAVSGLVAVDLWRYRSTAEADTAILASVIAENTAAAVQFNRPDEAQESLATSGKRSSVRRACLYRADGSLFARFEPRLPAYACPSALPSPSSWSMVTGRSQVVRNSRILGDVYIERELTELWPSVVIAVAAGGVMLVLAGLAAVPIANRLHRRISEPIMQLSAAARRIGGETPQESLPPIDSGLVEIEELVRAFSDMLRRVAEANAALRQRETEREELLRRERDAGRLKDEFLAAVSHELRTPLNAIVGWVQILATTTPDPQTMAKGIASIARNARTQTRVIEDLVDVSRIVAGKLNLRTDAVDLRDAVDGGIDGVRAAAQAKNVNLVASVPGHPCIVNGDRDRLQQVVGNLLSNAVKFTGSGGTVSLTLGAIDGCYEIAVADTGIGISADFLPFVFDRFRQADGSLTREHGGLGLGLAIVRELTALHGGSVEVESPGRNLGATFRLRLPALIEGPSPVVRREKAAAPGPALAGVRVLAVDDNADTLELLGIGLSAAGAHVRTAGSAAAAVDLFDREVPDVLLCDLAMPEVDGFELLQRLRQRGGQAGRVVPAIALSAHATTEHRERSRRAGFREHVAKPFRIETVIQAIRASLRLPSSPPRPDSPAGGADRRQ
jgi:signal transduction histidine kinase/ActR/RegA family two-component response regulator